MENCIFCKIIAGEIPSNKAYEDEFVLAFHDLDPKAPTHILIVPKKHFSSVLELGEADGVYAARLFQAANTIAREMGLDQSGFRLVLNTGEDGGQSVPHLHMHLLGGRALGWPPG